MASNDLVNLIIAKIKDERGVHAETAITAAGSLAGYFLLKQTEIDVSKLPPGSPVFTDGVNELGPKMVGFMSTVCVKLGMDGQTGWNTPISNEHKPLRQGIDLVRLLYPAFENIVAKYKIPAEGKAIVSAAAAIKLVKMASGNLNPEIGKAIAIFSLVAGSKTVPLPN